MTATCSLRHSTAFVTGSMNFTQFDTLINDKGYPKLADYLHTKFPGTIVAAIGEKNYAVHTMGGPDADMRITFGSRTADCDDVPNEPTDLTWRGPAGDGVPTYIASPVCGRFYVDADRSTALDYGTLDTSPAWMYPVEGNRDVPGFDEEHKGGDVWVTDVAFDVMDNEDWSGLLLTYGGIDKAGHMWGGLNDRAAVPTAETRTCTWPSSARIADEQVGRVVEEAEGRESARRDADRAHHRPRAADEQALLRPATGSGRGNFNWYYGADADETYLTPQPEIAGLVEDLDGQRRDEHAGLRDPHLAARRLVAGQEPGRRGDVDAGRGPGDVRAQGRSLPAGLERAAVEVDGVGVEVVARARPGDRGHGRRRLRAGRDRAAARQRELRRGG